jgi:hypothetical protein
LLWESNPTDHRVAGTVHREVLCVSLRNAPRVPACSIGPDYPRGRVGAAAAVPYLLAAHPLSVRACSPPFELPLWPIVRPHRRRC